MAALGKQAIIVLQAHLPGSVAHQIGDEIWQESLGDAIRFEAEAAAEHATSFSWGLGRAETSERLIVEMSAALQSVGDTYEAPDGVRYSLMEVSALEPDNSDTIASVNVAPVIEVVLSFEKLPAGASGSRRAVVRWSDGTEGEALRWYDDEILVSEGDLIGKTREELGALHFRRDKDWLQS